jgi:hypothetical protein
LGDKKMRTAARVLGSIVLLGASVASSSQSYYYQKYSVDAIHAHLYYQATGKVDPTDLLDGNVHRLWNTIIGGGEARMPSCAIWVLVDLAGPAFVQLDGKLVVRVTEGNKTLLDKTFSLKRWFSEGYRVTLPFLVYGTGCAELKITAMLKGLPPEKVKSATLTKSVPFECGE